MSEPIIKSLTEWLIPGILQGLTEVFPVSSSAHLALFGAFWSSVTSLSGPSFSGTIFLHISIIVAVLFSYWSDVKKITSDFMNTLISVLKGRWNALNESTEWKIVPGLVIATIVTGVIAIPMKSWAENLFSHPASVGILLVVNGIMLRITGNRKGEFLRIDQLGITDYLIIGLLQGVAVVPGISRFGVVLCVALWRKLAWNEALKLSFLFTLPVIIAVNGYEIVNGVVNRSNVGWPQTEVEVAQLLLGILLASVISIGAIKMLRKGGMYAYRRLNYFATYCITVGLFTYIFFVTLG